VPPADGRGGQEAYSNRSAKRPETYHHQGQKEVAANDDTQEAVAFNIDMDHYTELSNKNFLELEEKLEVKKYNLAMHYGN